MTRKLSKPNMPSGRRFPADTPSSINLGFSKIGMVPEAALVGIVYLMAAHAGPDLEDVEIGRALMLQAGEGRVANRARQMRLAFLDRLRIFGGGHRVLAEASIIQLFDVHRRMLARLAAGERRQSGSV